MICYLDRAFCSKSSHCMNTKCSRLLTEELSKKADEWWGQGPGEAPIAFSNFQTEDCGYVRKKPWARATKMIDR